MAYTESEARNFVEADPIIENQYTAALRNIAGGIVEDAAKVRSGQKVLIWFDDPGVELVKQINLRCQAAGADIRFFRRDYRGDAAALPDLDEDQIRGMFDREQELMNWAENVIIIRNPQDPTVMGSVPSDKKDIYTERYSQVHERRDSGDVDWTLFLYPTEYEAQKEGVDYETYFREVMDACNQPWEAIHETQQILKEKLDNGKALQLIANEDDPDPNRRTNVTMSIDGMTFCNSTVDRNYPGSEVFSAPVIDSVNGQIFALGDYEYNGHLMTNILFKIENGKIVHAKAEVGDEGLQQILNNGKGGRYFGEVAFGTNPGLSRRYFNPLLNEKVGGSFHMAIGHCYTYDTYGGELVNLNNGNTLDKAPVHWDVTIQMRRNQEGIGGGKVILDGEVIQEDGIFKDQALSLLNPKQ